MHTNLFTFVLIVIISVLILKDLIVVRTETVSAR
jgi:hypothetical protein